jgi:hypothetical protein
MRFPRLRFTLRSMMILILFIGLASALVIQSVRATRRDHQLTELTLLLRDYRRAADRMEWAERMYEKGYLSKAQIETEKVNLKRALFELGLHH